MGEEVKVVQLTELEYHKLLRYIEAATSLEAQSQLLVAQATKRVEEAHKLKDDYFDQLASKYPDLDKNIRYAPREADFSLIPQE